MRISSGANRLLCLTRNPPPSAFVARRLVSPYAHRNEEEDAECKKEYHREADRRRIDRRHDKNAKNDDRDPERPEDPSIQYALT